MSIEDRAKEQARVIVSEMGKSLRHYMPINQERIIKAVESALLAERRLALEEALEVIKHHVICDWKNNKYEKDFEDIKECFSFAIRKLMGE